MSKRMRIVLIGIAGVVVVSAIAAGLVFSAPHMVRVETGEVVTCTYGEAISSNIKVVEVPSEKVANYKVVQKTVTCARHKHLEELYAQAQTAILASDLTTARAKLAEIVAGDAAFKRAKAQLAEIDAGKKPVADTTTPGGTPVGGTGSKEGTPTGPIANLVDHLPDTLPGYTAKPIIADPFSMSRQYVPGKDSPTDSLVIVLEQYAGEKAAKAAIGTVIAPHYGFDVTTVNIAGVDVRFGTDGKRFATLAWTEGGVFLAIEAASASGKPEKLKNHLVSLAGLIVK